MSIQARIDLTWPNVPAPNYSMDHDWRAPSRAHHRYHRVLDWGMEAIAMTPYGYEPTREATMAAFAKS
jgi:hypothetical protein